MKIFKRILIGILAAIVAFYLLSILVTIFGKIKNNSKDQTQRAFYYASVQYPSGWDEYENGPYKYPLLVEYCDTNCDCGYTEWHYHALLMITNVGKAISLVPARDEPYSSYNNVILNESVDVLAGMDPIENYFKITLTDEKVPLSDLAPNFYDYYDFAPVEP